MKKLVNAPISNTIYWATVNKKTNVMNTETRIDVTDDAIDVVFEHITNLNGFKIDGLAGYKFPKRDSDEYATLCVFKSDKYVCISKDKYDELLEYKAKYEDLCR